jgi:poly[(R)-3-hydroxyalkanoate] polymerase subunit PhaC
MTTSTPPRTEAPDLAAALDMLLADAAMGLRRRFRPAKSVFTVGRRLATRPTLAARHARALGGQLIDVVRGRSQLAPHPRDRRFADSGWAANPILHRSLQGYLATAMTADQLVGDLELEGPDDERVRFAISNLVDAAAPSNIPILNPAAIKEFVDTGGASAVRGVRAFVTDMSSKPRVPRMVEPDAFEVGRTLAVSPGAVVHRDELYELIQFTPQTAQVHATPLLIVPPTINKYYVLDLAPGRSLIEFLVSQGIQVFTISWRNPDARFRDRGLDSYGAAVVDALAAVRSVAHSPTANLMGVCSGGIIASMVMAHLAATGERHVDAFTLLVTVLDQAPGGLVGSLIDETTAKAAMQASARQGYLDGNALAEVFAWLRPNDLIWNYWVNNYLLGRKAPAFDVLYWNSDTTRMPAQMHHDFLRIAMQNALVTPNAATMMGTPVDLGKIEADNYIVAGVADHICRWQSCFESTQLLGGPSRFVLSTSGHIAALVNPPGNPKASYQVGDSPGADADDWARTTDTLPGTWWTDYASWLQARSGRSKRAPRSLGGHGFEAREPAPGTYVFDR